MNSQTTEHDAWHLKSQPLRTMESSRLPAGQNWTPSQQSKQTRTQKTKRLTFQNQNNNLF